MSSTTPPPTTCERLSPGTAGGVEALDQLLNVPDHPERLIGSGRQRFDEDALVRPALPRLWIALGEAARRYCEAEKVELRMPPWVHMIGVRDKLAHLYLSEPMRRAVRQGKLSQWSSRRALAHTASQTRTSATPCVSRFVVWPKAPIGC